MYNLYALDCFNLTDLSRLHTQLLFSIELMKALVGKTTLSNNYWFILV